MSCFHFRFVKEYFAEPRRGYGSNVIDVFAVLRATKFRDVYGPAAMQFNGHGSYGNGGTDLKKFTYAVFFNFMKLVLLVEI